MKNLSVFLVLIVISVAIISLLTTSTLFDDEVKPGVYTYMVGVDNHPNDYLLVLGRFVTDFERDFADDFQNKFGVTIVSEIDLNKQSNLILVGNPSTNLLLDKLLREKYYEDESMISISEKNLLIIFNSDTQAKNLLSVVSNYKNEFYRLSPSTIIWGIHGPLVYILIGILIIIPLMIFCFEKRRNQHTIRKIEYLKDYFKKYEDEGHTKEELKKWLLNYGYDEKLIKVASDRHA